MLKQHKLTQLLLLSLCLIFSSQTSMANEATLSLAGKWRFSLDADDVGVAEKWYSKKLDDTVTLPGTTDENHKGILKNEAATDRLSRVWYWKGPAWYQRDVTIPESWNGKKINLLLERSKNTRVWIDGTFCGWHDSLSAAQIFDVTKAMTPGKHTITVVVDNAKLPPVGPSHAVDERTQTNWNGIIGKIELSATDPVWLDDVQVYPNAAKKEARVRVVVGNSTAKPISGNITVDCKSYNVDKPNAFKPQTIKVDKEGVIEFVYTPGDNVPLWDEFQPAMLRLNLKLETKVGNKTFTDTQSVNFGMRDFGKDRNLLKINGKTVFLRGRLDCANYPLTGYPPMDKAEWLRIFKITLDWGINHYRFHSWCPPKAAFEAADELGIYLQPEIPSKRSGYKTSENKEAGHWNIDRLNVESTETKVTLYDYAKREGEQIFEQFGNHPSFVMFTLGNELGRNQGMFEMVDYFKKIDPRRLHAQGANNMHWNPSLAEGDEFWITGKVEKGAKPLRGSFSLFDFPDAPIESFPPSTLFDFSESIEGLPVPMIGHETGQFQVYPDYRDIPKFTGVVRAKNYEIFRERLKQAGMLDQAHDFVRASGALAALCYREDIEMALRTPGLAGIQLLDIQDFPGQGTALVGMLNDFYESKGVIEEEKWRQFCSETVPLIRMKKYTWTNDETFLARAQIAHYGPADIENAQVTWTLSDSQGNKLAADKFDQTTIKQGKVCDIDLFSIPLKDVRSPEKLTITLAIEGTKFRNDYNIWVYPSEVDTSAPAGVMLAENFQSEKTKTHLAKGGSVLLLPKHENLPLSIKGGFQSDFWSPMFSMSAKMRDVDYPAPGTLGFLCDPKSPAFNSFPTDFHTNWQWWHLLKNSRPIKFDGTPDNYRPIVQMVDNFVRNSKLGLIAETKVGKGKLLICAVDLLAHQDKPEARQLLHSLLQYAGSKNFNPKSEIEPQILNTIFPK